MGRLTKLMPLVAVGVAVGSMGFLWWLKTAVRLEVANPLSRPVLVKVDDSTPMQVGPESTGSMKVAGTGSHLIEVTDLEGAHIETAVAVLRGNFRINVYNVLGLAPVFTQRITYSKYSNDLPPRVTVHCGDTLFDVEDVDYLWVDPPQSVSLGKSSQVTKFHLGLAKGGMRSCMGHTLQNGLPLEVGECQEQFDQPPQQRALGLTQFGEAARGAGLIRQRLARTLDDLSAHRTLQYIYNISVREASLRPEYEAALAKATATGDGEQIAVAQYLAARIAPPEQREGLLRSALQRAPGSFWLQYALGVDAVTRGRDAEALSLLERVAVGAPAEVAVPVRRSYITALMRAGKPKVALAHLDAYAAQPEVELELTDLLIWRAVGEVAGAVRPPPGAVDPVVGYQKGWLAAFDAMSKGETMTPAAPEGKPESELATRSRELSVRALLDPARALSDVRIAIAHWGAPTSTVRAPDAWEYSTR